ncbi:esterase-like activity of phytase family protein [Pseudoponticoccus marisrubri]|uniref:Alkaline phosphatase n=1 Tax=Pseudoponticoccus marisrubri TaxID=1685382 RepID=A0A0W7WJB2_9RHOB|nr:esterase-like activity of phytase family protein [Pseudoponticoccus marisrubri]KUF10623.1 alkaline phosphatase [Pseudoponticoccus marisrubri]
MHFRTICLTSALALSAATAHAGAHGEMNFNRIASFATVSNMAEGEDTSRETSAEIIAATADGMTLVYTDSPLGVLGRIDITDPANPQPLGNIALGGEPTAVGIAGGMAIVGVNTSASYTDPSGYLAAINIDDGSEAEQCDLGGQPDSVAIAKDGSFAAVAIENERDEDLGDGRVGQMPAGFLVKVGLTAEGLPDCDTLQKIELTGLADVAPEDPEPEFVDINALGEVVVSLQENNHMVVVGADGSVMSHFSAGAVDLEGIDTTEEGALTFTDSQSGVVREPDAVKWLDDNHFATANEGDMDGGSRGWTIFHKDGTVVYESGTSFERALIEIGHYPEERSGNKGVEPESIETATFGDTPMVFVGSERGSVVGVYDVTDPTAPVLKQLLPSGIGPEGYVALPERNLLVSANEVGDAGPNAHVMLFEYAEGAASYPQLTSAGADELIGWGAISGMVAGENGIVYAVNDSFYGMQPTIFTIDTTQSPARITDALRITREGAPAQLMDMEGIALDGDGGFYVASEGRLDRGILHAIHHVSAEGEIEETIPFPKGIMAVERRWAAEGVAKVGDTLWVAIQREFDDDPENHTKLLAYNLESGEWGAVHYPKEAAESGWVGLSEITAHDDHVYLIERDNKFSDAQVKQITRVSVDQLTPAPIGSELPVVEKEVVYDLIPDLKAQGGYVVDKVEGLAIFEDGTTWVSTDNDGVDDSSGETFFWTVQF